MNKNTNEPLNRLLDWVEENNVSSLDLDDLVNTLMEEEAEAINTGGIIDQLEYILAIHGGLVIPTLNCIQSYIDGSNEE